MIEKTTGRQGTGDHKSSIMIHDMEAGGALIRQNGSQVNFVDTLERPTPTQNQSK